MGRRILGVDPGSKCAGWAVVGGTSQRPVLLSSGEFDFPDCRIFAERLSRLYDAVKLVVERFEPTEAAVEAPFHGVNARSALQLAHARGVILAVLGGARVPVFEYTPATIKKAVTGNGRAEKAQVQSMVGRLMPDARPVDRSDVADAIAAALCHLFGAGMNDALRKQGLDGRRR